MVVSSWEAVWALMPGRATAVRRSGFALPQQAVPPPWLLPSAGPMTAHSGIRGPAAGLTGRPRERGVLDRFLAGVRAGEGRALVVRGEPGVGKTVLLDYLGGRPRKPERGNGLMGASSGL